MSHSAPAGMEMSAAQTLILSQAVGKVKETITRLAGEHRDLHSSVSKVGKTIDRVKLIDRRFVKVHL